MNDKQIALDYVAMHRDNNIDDWQPIGVSGDAKLKIIYGNLIAGQYGEIVDGCVEIAARESKHGRPILYELGEK